jgi:protein tyrosine phosphatase (PTP) superfamily phosphohydrolase (DUF442 family)
VVGGVLATAVEAVRVLAGGNFHVAVPGRVYRCAQPSASRLEQLVRTHGIRTVVNLRGCCPNMAWYQDECRVTHQLDVAQEDICLSAGRLPSVHEIRRLVQVLDHTEYPILIHCNRGADRTGLAVTAYLLLHTAADLSEARRHLGLAYGHLSFGKTGQLDRFFDLYAAWLRDQRLEHACVHFRRWAEREYCPGECRCELELIDPPAWVPCGEPTALQLRVRNISLAPWRLRPGINAGIHARYVLYDDQSRGIRMGRAGLFHGEVAPGQTIDLTLALPAVYEPGHYRLFVDMVDEQHCGFFQTGSEPLEWDMEVR